MAKNPTKVRGVEYKWEIGNAHRKKFLKNQKSGICEKGQKCPKNLKNLRIWMQEEDEKWLKILNKVGEVECKKKIRSDQKYRCWQKVGDSQRF